jgi:hypothetical protein
MTIRSMLLAAASLLAIHGVSAAQVTTDKIMMQGGLGDEAIVKAQLKLGMLRSTTGMLDSVDIRASEVDAFLDVRGMLVNVVSKGTSAKKSDDDPIAVEFRSRQLLAFSQLLQRTKPNGADSVTVQSVQKILDDAYRSAVSSKK